MATPSSRCGKECWLCTLHQHLEKCTHQPMSELTGGVKKGLMFMANDYRSENCVTESVTSQHQPSPASTFWFARQLHGQVNSEELEAH